jgi:hypothetical protein
MQGDSLGPVAPLLIAQHDPSKVGLDDTDARSSLLKEALSTDPGSPELRKLERQLRTRRWLVNMGFHRPASERRADV